MCAVSAKLVKLTVHFMLLSRKEKDIGKRMRSQQISQRRKTSVWEWSFNASVMLRKGRVLYIFGKKEKNPFLLATPLNASNCCLMNDVIQLAVELSYCRLQRENNNIIRTLCSCFLCASNPTKTWALLFLIIIHIIYNWSDLAVSHIILKICLKMLRSAWFANLKILITLGFLGELLSWFKPRP